MSFRRRAAIGIAALSSAALAVTGVVGLQAAGAAASAKVPTVTVHINKHIKLSRGTVHAGKVEFKVVTSNGGHILQIARLHKGYSLQQAGQDLNKAFQGDTKAIKRVDHRISFRGGAGTRPNKAGWMTVNLNKAGQYVLLDQNGPGLAFLKVRGKAPKHQAGPATTGNLRVFTYGFDPVGGPLPAHGWLRLANRSDQPHFVEMVHVKPNTTGKDVKKFIKSGARGAPSFQLRGHADSGVISPGGGQNLMLDVTPGKYLVACFWPDIMTGMPHFFMGMWRLVQLK